MEEFKKKAEEIRKSLEGKLDDSGKKNPAKYYTETMKADLDTLYDTLRLTLLPVAQDFEHLTAQYPDIIPDLDPSIQILTGKLMDIASILLSVQEKIQELNGDVLTITTQVAESVKNRYGVDL